jgi:hypothetical protein
VHNCVADRGLVADDAVATDQRQLTRWPFRERTIIGFNQDSFLADSAELGSGRVSSRRLVPELNEVASHEFTRISTGTGINLDVKP